MEPLRLTIYSDFICPFCYVGEKVIERVRRRHPVALDWVGYEIHPEIPESGGSMEALGAGFRDYLRERVLPLAERMDVRMDIPDILPNTHLALEGAAFAKNYDGLDAYRLGVFDAYFQEGLDIGSHAVLSKIAENAGLPPGDFSDALDDRAYFDVVEENREEALDRMVTGVPTVIFEGGLRIVGAQSEEVFEQFVKRVLEMRREGETRA